MARDEPYYSSFFHAWCECVFNAAEIILLPVNRISGLRLLEGMAVELGHAAQHFEKFELAEIASESCTGSEITRVAGDVGPRVVDWLWPWVEGYVIWIDDVGTAQNQTIAGAGVTERVTTDQPHYAAQIPMRHSDMHCLGRAAQEHQCG